MEEQFRKEEELWRNKLVDSISRSREEEDKRLARAVELKRQELQDLEARVREEEPRMRHPEADTSSSRLSGRTTSPRRSPNAAPAPRSSSGRRPSGGRHPHVGVEIKMLDDTQGNRDSVVVVHSVIPNGPAHKAGLRMDDIIDKWNGDRLASKHDWIDCIKTSRIGSIVHLSVVRDGRTMDMPVTIGAAGGGSGGTRKVASKTTANRGGRSASPGGGANRSRSAGRR